jgi:serine/threonine-protein kinase
MTEVKDDLERLYLMMRSATMLSMTQVGSGVWRHIAPKALPSVAVLPFLNLSSDKENEYFSDGLAEEIINALTRLGNLRVTARTSAFVFRGAQQDVKQIGGKLGVANVLEGSVRKAGNRVRVSVQLIGVEEGNNLWSERFDREMTDVFEIQDEISQAIAAKLKVRLGSQSGSGPDTARPAGALVKRYTENLEAYDLYLKGRFELYKMTRDGLDAAKALFGEAIRLDANYALAYDGLAYALYSEGFLGFVAPNDAMPKAKDAVRRALELDPGVGEAHATLGVILALHEWDWVGAEREFLRAIGLNGASPVSRDMYAFFFLRPVGRIEEAIAETQQALSLDPLSILFRVHLGFLFYLERQYEHAIAQFRKVLEISPEYYLAHAMLGQVYTLAGNFAHALDCYEKARSADSDSKFVDSLKAMTLAAANRREEALLLAGKIAERAAGDYISPVSIAYIFTFLGEAGRAFENLERGLDERDPNLLGLKSNPIFDPLRTDARYSALLRKMHLEA